MNLKNSTAIAAVDKFAADFATRFSSVVNYICSWNTADPTDLTVIIDNMMNLEVLFASEALTGNHTLRDIALAHADRTAAEHVRYGGSAFPLTDYNSHPQTHRAGLFGIESVEPWAELGYLWLR
jgi:hypothetical protein